MRRRITAAIVGVTAFVLVLVGVPLASRRQFIRTHSRRTDVMACAGWSVAGEQRDRVAGLTAALKHHENAIAEALELRALVSALVRQVEGIDAFLG